MASSNEEQLRWMINSGQSNRDYLNLDGACVSSSFNLQGLSECHNPSDPALLGYRATGAGSRFIDRFRRIIGIITFHLIWGSCATFAGLRMRKYR